MTTSEYKSLYDVWSSDAFKKKQEVAQRNVLQEHDGRGPGKYTGGSRRLHNQSCTSYCISKRDNASTYDEPKANVECLHIENCSPMPTDEQLMFEATDGSNKGHVYDFGSQSAAITTERRKVSSSSSLVSLVTFVAAHDAWIEREKRLWEIHVAGTGQVSRLHDLIRLSVSCAARFGTHFVLSFPYDG
ncbi:hypothetical protein M9H77_25991 [Catharanthus roseus]|uniref:Uncharacterized protein n=1 Tax=Catharanthus roseus TaxID=4058 RepID=A0ACC0AB28_CATRO|nr:hypothetical protein M9H77_25991 [Catharanthus roseus]